MKSQALLATGLIVTLYLTLAILVHHEETKKRANFTLCPLCNK